MKQLIKLAVFSVISTAIISAPLTTASAYSEYYYRLQNPPHYRSTSHYISSDHRIHHHHYRHTERQVNYNVHKYYVERNNAGDALVAGVLGFAVGAILSEALKKPQQPEIIYQVQSPSQVIYRQLPQTQVIYQVQPTTTYQITSQPQEVSWLQYCTQKYRTFNPQTGTFRGSDGLDHFCRAPLQ
ncbi:hypothetical protein BAnh1_08770 [Bartonella australis AUST/NH1]|uniref:Lectin-like protein BA14k n=1 Tax=Bartonella australis (strain Aust/NH1) TaxID=1094489 RepID=M1NTW6_BARAA|nr:BA14K family protein [Bartonella australis]AGF74753.1 hypothetical protein BAnh1_08770 [Bartonella australis AUST/NH1]